MNTLNDLTGKRFGRWRVLHQTSSKFKSRATIWHYRCDCENEKDVSRSNLLSDYSDTTPVVVDGFNIARNAIDKVQLMKMTDQIMLFAVKNVFLIFMIFGKEQ